MSDKVQFRRGVKSQLAAAIVSDFEPVFITDTHELFIGTPNGNLAVNGDDQNKLINGDFSVNQRAVSGTVTRSAGQYGHDRWKAGSVGCTYTFSTTDNVTTITITAGSLVQVIEGINLASGTHALSWTGTAQGKIGAGSYGASGITGAATGGANLSIEFNAGTLSKLQLTAGDVALPFQPRSFPEELALCQRYYEKSYDIAVAPATSSNLGIESKVVPSNTVAIGQTYGKVSFSVKKRVAPTVVIFPFTTPSNFNRVSANSGTDLAANSGNPTNVGQSGFMVLNSSGTTLTTTDSTVLFHWTTDAEI